MKYELDVRPYDGDVSSHHKFGDVIIKLHCGDLVWESITMKRVALLLRQLVEDANRGAATAVPPEVQCACDAKWPPMTFEATHPILGHDVDVDIPKITELVAEFYKGDVRPFITPPATMRNKQYRTSTPEQLAQMRQDGERDLAGRLEGKPLTPEPLSLFLAKAMQEQVHSLTSEMREKASSKIAEEIERKMFGEPPLFECYHEDPDHTGQCIRCQMIIDFAEPDIAKPTETWRDRKPLL